MYEEGFGVLGASFMRKCGCSDQKSDQKGRKCRKIAMLWLFQSHRSFRTLLRLLQHEYLLVREGSKKKIRKKVVFCQTGGAQWANLGLQAVELNQY